MPDDHLEMPRGTDLAALPRIVPPTDTPALIDAPNVQTVTHVEHWTDRLFMFRTTRPASLRFRSGEFVMIGLLNAPNAAGKVLPLLRAYSIASPAWDDELEFYSIKVADGPLTSRLQHIRPGDQILLKPKPVGTLVHDALLPGRRLWFFATGTGIAPFASLIREPQTYTDYESVILTHTCRDVAELEYGRRLVERVQADEILGELFGAGFRDKLVYYPTTTREPSPHMGRITTLVESGAVFDDLGLQGGLSPEADRAMVCGSLPFNADMKTILEGHGLREGANSEPAEYVVEKAFVG